ncbi:hypothetical protein [Methylocucumis oryzae]|uniref:Uncharacterized protein n=1 Tax=Methylocucumis oryzae TaxID=1632867 RepID=A0A0F3IJI4_9GAMM|nr:hypothetical protein [Methylocucumis oryzae]KJV06678.1 hypothetical protein VZ94_09755 [Methylocucumis oryzae]
MTEALLTVIQAWLLQHNAFEPVIRLIVAGSRHIHHGNKRNEFSNCCTVLNAFGDIEWQQEKRQPFNLTEREAHNLLNHKQAAFEPTQLANTVTLRLTALGLTATPICLDFFHDSLWKDLPIQVLLVPAMSPNLKRFHRHCANVGEHHLSSAFICNAEPNNKDKAVYAYIPSKQGLTIAGDLPLFTVEIEIDMN